MIGRQVLGRWLATLAAVGLVAALGGWRSGSAEAGRAQAKLTVQVVDGGDLGQILADAAGFTLYTFDRDEPGVSNCYDRCAQTWPPLTLDEGDPIPPDGLAGTLAPITRTDGSRQAAYNDQPLYRYAPDTQPGDIKGDGVGGVWHVAKPAAATVQIADGGALGMILTGANGMTLYTFDRDEPGVSNCYDRCAQVWPPLMLDAGTPVAPAGLSGTLSLVERADGSSQVAYDGRPLYFYAADTQPGDTTGEGVGGVWHVARPISDAE